MITIALEVTMDTLKNCDEHVSDDEYLLSLNVIISKKIGLYVST